MSAVVRVLASALFHYMQAQAYVNVRWILWRQAKREIGSAADTLDHDYELFNTSTRTLHGRVVGHLLCNDEAVCCRKLLFSTLESIDCVT